MNDIEYMLRQDAREKKAAGRGARCKRSGSKTTYVGLPSDHLTAAEKKRRNGPVFTFDITKRLSYEGFKKLPNDLAGEYIVRVQNTFNVSLSGVAQSMGDVSRVTLNRYLVAKGIEHRTSHTAGKPADNWQDFLDGKCRSDGTYFNAPKVEEPEPAPVERTPASVNDIDLGGHGTPEALLDLLLAAFSSLTSSGQTYEFAIHLHAEGGED